MKLGFTGTRRGMTDAQVEAFGVLFRALRPTELHHGDCIGADADAHHAAREDGVRTVIHPPINAEHRAWCKGDVELPPLPYFARNRAIVDATEMLIAASLTPHRTERGGTWYTVDQAVKCGKPVMIVWPDGRVEDWRGE